MEQDVGATVEPLTIESLARALVITRIEALALSGRSCHGITDDGHVYETLGWDDLDAADRETAMVQARLLFERIMR